MFGFFVLLMVDSYRNPPRPQDPIDQLIEAYDKGNR